MKLEEMLTSLPLTQWKIGKVYPFDWYDGPREGICSMNVPRAEFFFELLDERYNPDGLDDRLYRLSELPPGSMAEVLEAVEDFRSPEEAIQNRARQRLDAVVALKRPTALVIQSQDFDEFLGCWTIPRGANDRDVKWFEFLGIPEVESHEEV